MQGGGAHLRDAGLVPASAALEGALVEVGDGNHAADVADVDAEAVGAFEQALLHDCCDAMRDHAAGEKWGRRGGVSEARGVGVGWAVGRKNGKKRKGRVRAFEEVLLHDCRHAVRDHAEGGWGGAG